MTTEYAIDCRGLVKRFGTVTALAGLDLQVPVGTIFGFLGPNGAGKTTLLRILTGLIVPTAGRATVAGRDVVSQGAAVRARIGYLEQTPDFYPWMRGRELLAFVGDLYGLRGAALRSRIDELLTIVDLTAAANRRIGGYSGGMKQRLGLAQALLQRPEVLLLDEPVTALDPAGRHAMLALIERLRGETTVLLSSHILADVERICDRVAIINAGRLVVEADIAELQERYAQPIYLLAPEAGQRDETARLVQQLRAQPWVVEVVEQGEHVRVVVGDPAAARAQLLPLVVASGVALARFERGRPSLEDIFLRLVGAETTSVTGPERAEAAPGKVGVS